MGDLVMNGDLQTKGLLPFTACKSHVVHNSFHKGIQSLAQDVEQLAFDLHRWSLQAKRF